MLRPSPLRSGNHRGEAGKTWNVPDKRQDADAVRLPTRAGTALSQDVLPAACKVLRSLHSRTSLSMPRKIAVFHEILHLALTYSAIISLRIEPKRACLAGAVTRLDEGSYQVGFGEAFWASPDFISSD